MTAWWLWLLIVLVVVAAVATALGVVAARRRRRRTALLRDRFGSEYDRAIEQARGRRGGEADLEQRLRRRAQLQVAPTPEAERVRHEGEWREIEEQFDDGELAALARADALVTTILTECGYRMGGFDQRAADLSVDYPEEVGHYRRAHDGFRRADDGKATREDMYEALQHYRAFLDVLLAGGARTQERSDTQEVRA